MIEEKTSIRPGEPQLIPINKDVFLRKITPDDSKAMFALIDRNKEHLSQFGDETAKKYPTFESVDERNKTQSEEEKRFGIWDKEDLVGFVKVTRKEEGRWEIGYWMGSEYTKKGYMTTAVVALTKYAMDNLGANSVFALVHADNIASRRVLEKAGYLLKGQNPEDADEVILEKKKT